MNKKIGLITLHEADNYGTCLQAYALAETIKELGYCCEIVRFNRYSASAKKQSKFSVIKELGIKQTIDILLSKEIINRQKKKFKEFRSTNLPLSSDEYKSISELEHVSSAYDAFVTGSDMVWSWESRSFLDVYFLKFVPAGKRIAYAPSFGSTEFSEEMIRYYRTAIAGIDYCSCREYKGTDFIKRICKNDCQTVLDPTMLLNMDKWRANFQLKKTSGKKSILFYIFGDIPAVALNNARSIYGNDGEVRYIPGHFKQYRYEKKYGNDAFGPSDFLESYYNADMILTNTYHGLVFALIFRKPFVLFHRMNGEHWAMHEERMASLLEQLGLSDRYILLNEKIENKYLTLDYSLIEDKIEEMRKSSLQYLKDAINSALTN